MFSISDFNVVETNTNGHFVRIEELNEMVKGGVIIIDKEKLEKYKMVTRTVTTKHTDLEV